MSLVHLVPYGAILQATVSSHSTDFSNICLNAEKLRILLIAYAGQAIYDNGRSFVCNTMAIGCENECYSALMASPAGIITFLTAHVMMITLAKYGYALYVTMGEKRARRDPNRDAEEEGPKAPKACMFQLLMRIALEVLFLFGQYRLYGLEMKPRYKCSCASCMTTVTCYPSRHHEKTCFLRTMYAINSICLFFTVLEMLYLGVRGLAESRLPE